MSSASPPPDKKNFTQPINRLVFLLQIFLIRSFCTYEDTMMMSKFSNKYNEKQICLINYLKTQVKAGVKFFKSKYIAKDTGLSSKEVGTNMAILSEIYPELRIERYSYSNSTTWLITPTLA